MPGALPSRTQRAFTLVEVMISAGLFALVLAGAYFVLVLSMRFHNRLEDQVTTFQRALVAANRMSQSLGTGLQTSLVVEDGVGFAFLSASPPTGPFTQDGNGRPEWQKIVFFYLQDEVLYKGELPVPASATPPSTPQPSTLIANSSASRQQVAQGVTALTVTAGSGASTRLTVRGEEDNEINLVTRVTFRQ